jgi:hypothetical protein
MSNRRRVRNRALRRHDWEIIEDRVFGILLALAGGCMLVGMAALPFVRYWLQHHG